jgi:hypothetical protein
MWDPSTSWSARISTPQRRSSRPAYVAGLQAEDLLDVGDLLVVGDLADRGVPDVEQPAQGNTPKASRPRPTGPPERCSRSRPSGRGALGRVLVPAQLASFSFARTIALGPVRL